ncbi:MAG: hypothetical protein IJN66_02160 [Muribaculaceae bacterium]|nr:hypothetical protein [Muribaculaceae bacterium]
MAVSFVIYTSFQPITAERYAMYSMTALCGFMVVYAIGLLMKKNLMLGLVSKSGLVLTAISFIIGVVLWLWELSPQYVLLSISFYVLGQIVFVVGTWVNLSVKLSHILFYVTLVVCYMLRSVSAQSVVAVVSMVIVAYPMAVSYFAVNWASKEFFKLNK